MIIFLYGEDTYRLRQKLGEIIEEYKKINKSGLSLKHFDCQDFKNAFTDFRNENNQTAMFKEKKLLIVTNIFTNSDLKEKFLKELKYFKDSDDIILIYEEKKVNGRDSLFKFLKKNAKCQSFDLLGGQKLKNWAKKEFEIYGKKVSPEIIDILVVSVGNDLWRLSNEIRKLVSFKKEGAIKKEDIKNLIRAKIETDIFETIDAIAQKNKKMAIDLLHKHLEKGDSPLYLLSMINFQFRNLLIIKELVEKRNTYNAILRKSNLHPFVVKKSYFQSQKFSFEELKKIYRKIFQVDLEIKTGKIEPEVALDMLIAEI